MLLVASTPASLLIYTFRSSRRFNTLQFHETVSADKLIMIVYIDVSFNASKYCASRNHGDCILHVFIYGCCDIFEWIRFFKNIGVVLTDNYQYMVGLILRLKIWPTTYYAMIDILYYYFKKISYIFLFVNIIIIVIVSSNKGVMYLCRFVGVSVCLSV